MTSDQFFSMHIEFMPSQVTTYELD